jgi:transposase
MFAARVRVEIRLSAVTEVNNGAPVGEVAERYGVTRQTVTAWRTRYEADGLADQSRRAHSGPGRIAPDVEDMAIVMVREWAHSFRPRADRAADHGNR